MSDLGLGTGSSKRRGPHDPEDVLQDIMDEMPGSTEKETWPLFWGEVQKDEDLIKICVRRYHLLARSRLERKKLRSAAVRAKSKAATATVVEELKKILILDIVMPNGKRLRECTFKYARQVGGWISRLAKHGKPNQIIGDVLSDDEAEAAVKG